MEHWWQHRLTRWRSHHIRLGEIVGTVLPFISKSPLYLHVDLNLLFVSVYNTVHFPTRSVGRTIIKQKSNDNSIERSHEFYRWTWYTTQKWDINEAAMEVCQLNICMNKKEDVWGRRALYIRKAKKMEKIKTRILCRVTINRGDG